MEFKEVKNLLTDVLKWNVTDIFYVCTDQDMFDYYLVYKNHRIKSLVAIDRLNKCVSGIWN